MRTSGQRPTPTQQQINQGDPRRKGKKKLAEKLASEPKHETGLPSCPPHLRGKARDAWRIWSQQLEIAGMDKRPDQQALEGAAVAYGRAVAADILVENQGLILSHKVRDPVTKELHEKFYANPAAAISHREWMRVKSFIAEFGFSPGSRTRIHVEKPKPGIVEARCERLGRDEHHGRHGTGGDLAV